MTIKIYSPNQQVSEVFPGGSIRVQKPIGFPHQDSVVRRVGPLFYWSWAHTEKEGGIGLHPHEGFEIMSYVLNGKLVHGDTLGTESAVGQGGAQVMQTGSGVSHQEKFFGPDGEAFQIWLEPHLSESLKRPPTYADYRHEDFPLSSPAPGVSVKTILGGESPIKLVTDAKMWDITVEPGNSYAYELAAGYSWAALAIRGDGTWEPAAGDGEPVAFRHKDFSVIETPAGGKRFTLRAGAEQALRMAVIEVPAKVDYPLYRK